MPKNENQNVHRFINFVTDSTSNIIRFKKLIRLLVKSIIFFINYKYSSSEKKTMFSLC